VYRPGGMIYSNPSPRPGRPNGWGFYKKIDRKPGQRLLAMLSNQGLQPNQQITFLLGGCVFSTFTALVTVGSKLSSIHKITVSLHINRHYLP
jgi:hypothetical protein